MPTRATRNNVLIWGGVLLAATAFIGWLLPSLALAVFLDDPRELVIERLEERFDDVRLDALDVSIAPGIRLVPRFTASGAGLSVGLPGRAGTVVGADPPPPFIRMERFTVDVDLIGVLRDPIRVRSLTLDQLDIQIPPGGMDGDDDDEKERDDEAPREDGSGTDGGEDAPPAFVIERLTADGTLLRILPDERGKEPLDFVLHQLSVDSAGLGEPMRFDAVLDNAKPPGEIQTEGSFGPLRLSDVGASPVSGSYVFERAKLGEFGGIAGTLHSEGEFSGVLSRIDVSGSTTVPDFQLTSAGHPLNLETRFAATVDGTNGDTFLTPVEARLGESPIVTSGGVFQRAGTDGKTVCLDASGEGGRIEDFLHLAMASEPPLMTGDIAFRSLILIPPGESDVVEKLVLDGEMWIASARFTRPEIQEKVDGLSEVGRGKNGADGAVAALANERVLSDLRAGFALRDGVLEMSGVAFSVPGARVTLEGTYGLLDEAIDFRGELRLEAKLSETTTGIKSFLLKLVDPLFERDDAGAVIPIRIGGTASEPSFGPELGRVLTRREVAPPEEVPEGGRFTKAIPTCAASFGARPKATPSAAAR